MEYRQLGGSGFKGPVNTAPATRHSTSRPSQGSGTENRLTARRQKHAKTVLRVKLSVDFPPAEIGVQCSNPTL